MTYLEALSQISKLESNLKADYILAVGPTLFRRLSRMGLIKCGVAEINGVPVSTSTLTPLGKRQVSFIESKPGKKEVEVGEFYESRGAHFSV